MSPVRAFVRLEGLSALRHRNFRLFWSGQQISLIGTWMQMIAEAWLVLTLTGDPLWLGVVTAAQFAPVMVFGLFGGIIADSLPKRRTLVATQTIAMGLAFVLAVLTLTHTVQVWHVILIAFALGCTSAIDMPTRQAFVIEMVGREHIGNAVALNSATFNAARIVGPAVAGVAIGIFDIGVAFLINGLSFLAVLASLVAMRPTELRPSIRVALPRSAREVVANLAEGLRYVSHTPLVLLAVGVVGLVSTAGMNFGVVIPAFAKDVLGTGAAGYGFLMAASGVGSLLAALTIAFRGRPDPRVIVGGAILLGALEVALGFTRSMPLAILCMFGIGVGGISMAAMANTTIQLNVPDMLRGRVLAVYATVFAGSTPIGGLAFGAVASTVGPALAVTLGGAVAGAVGLGAAAWAWRRGLLRSIPERATRRRSALAHDPDDRAVAGHVGERRPGAPLIEADDQADGVVVGMVRVVDPERDPARRRVERVAVGQDLVVRSEATRVGARNVDQA
ncbi:MAG: MFS transporter [Chloroflexota bacterium]|nr:MFS transporter [Chloroflexota bacterium]